MAQIILDEGAAAATPSANKVAFYAKADGLIYSKDDAGVESVVSGAALAGSATQAFSVAAATAAAHAPQAAQIQSGALVNISAALTGTEYAATPAPAITAYTAGQRFMVTFDLACPAAPTLKLNGIATPPNLVRQLLDGSYVNLAALDFPAGWLSPVKLISTTQVLVESLPRRVKIVDFTRDLTAATGSVSITGVGFKPSKVTFLGRVNTTSVSCHGMSTGVGNACDYFADSAGSSYVDVSKCLAFVTTSGNYQTATATMIADGFTLAWTKTLSPTGTATIVACAEE